MAESSLQVVVVVVTL